VVGAGVAGGPVRSKEKEAWWRAVGSHERKKIMEGEKIQ